jgi:hypothetical protein
MKQEIDKKRPINFVFNIVSVGVVGEIFIGIFAPLGFIRIYSWIMVISIITFIILNMREKNG